MQQQPYRRDLVTWVAYWMLAWFAFMQASLGPLMPFLRDDLRFDYTVSGLHLTSYALGVLLSGLVGDRASARFGRQRVFWGGALGMALGGAVLVAARTPWLTVLGTFLMGWLGALLLMTVQSILSDRHPEWRALALAEANSLASAMSCLGPPLLAGAHQLGLGWRAAIVLAIAFALTMAAFFARLPLSEPVAKSDKHEKTTLPPAFWGWWAVMFFGIAVEISMVAWSAMFLESAVGLEKSRAALLLTVFLVAMAAGRVAGIPLARRVPSVTLLARAQWLAAAGLLLFWLPRTPFVSVVGLLICGLGVANFYPLTLTMAVGAAAGNTDAASARILSAAGLATLTIPLAVGVVADHSSLFTGYSIIAAMLVLAAVLRMRCRKKAE